jgi:FtsZ-interacting cell division protein ZipA
VSQPEPQLPDVADVLVSTTASLVNLAGIRLTEKEHHDPAKAKEAIDAARQLLPLCPEEAVGPIKDALSQVQMLYVRETQTQGAPPAEDSPAPDDDAKQRAEARSKIWTPPGS